MTHVEGRLVVTCINRRNGSTRKICSYFLVSKGKIAPVTQRIERPREREGGVGKPLDLSQLTDWEKDSNKTIAKNRGLFQS
jgi:hypothetical protein